MSEIPENSPNEDNVEGPRKRSFWHSDVLRNQSFPSAGTGKGPLRTPIARRKRPFLLRNGVVFLWLCGVLAIFTYGELQKGVSSPSLTNTLMVDISSRMGPDYDLQSKAGRMVLNGTQLAIQLEDMTIAHKGEALARLDVVNLELSAKALLSRQIQIQEVAVQGVTINYAQNPEPFSFPKHPDLLAQGMSTGLKRLLAFVERTQLRHIELAEISAPNGLTLSSLQIDKSNDVGDVSFDVAGALRFMAQDLPINGFIALRNQAIEMQIEMTEFDLAALPYRPDGPCGGMMSLLLMARPQGAVERFDASVNVKDGFCIHPKAGPVDLAGTARLGIQTDRQHYDIANLTVNAGKSQFVFDGGFDAEVLTFGDDTENGFRFELISDRSVAHSAISQEPPLVFPAKFAGSFRPSNRTLDIETIALRTANGGTIDGQALLSFAQNGPPALFVSLQAEALTVSEAKQLWPFFAAQGGNQWVHRSVFGGKITSAKLDMRVPPGILGNGQPLSDSQIWGSAEITGTRLDTVGELPAIRDANGSVTFAGTNVAANLSQGSAYLNGEKKFDLLSAVFMLDNAHIIPAFANLDATVKSRASDLAFIASLSPINAGKTIDIKPDELSGNTTTKITLSFPVNGERPRVAPIYAAEIAFSELDIIKPINGRDLRGLSGKLNIADSIARIEAKGLLDGLPGSFALVEPFGQKKDEAALRERNVSLTLDTAAIKKLSPQLAKYVSGKITAKVVSPPSSSQNNSITQIDADLTAATIEFAALGIKKPQGTAGRARFGFTKQGGETRISDLVLDGKNLSAKGNIVVAKAGLKTADLRDVQFPGASGFTLNAVKGKSGLVIGLNGQSYDARTLLKQFANLNTGSNSNAALGDFQLQARVERVIAQNDETVSGVSLAFRSLGSETNIDIRGALSNGQSVRVSKNDIGNNDDLKIQTGDAGRMLRASGLYTKMTGGELTADLRAAGKGVYQGPVSLSNFTVSGEPKLKALVTTGGNRSLDAVTKNKIISDSVSFRKASADVQYGKNFLIVRDGLIGGQEVGFTMEGKVFDAQKSMDLSGTFLPAYGLNRLLGGIPILGQILGNGEKGGLIGITYKLEGNFRDPRIYVNPLSVVAPGIFREIFRF